MFSFLNRLSVRNRIWTIVAIFIGSIVLGSVIDILILRNALWHEKELKTRQLVESGYSVLAHYHDLQVKGELSETAARAAAIGTLRAMRYDGKEYYWLNDLGTPYPRMVMHPTVPELDGQVLDAGKFNGATSWRVGDDGDFIATDGRKNLFSAFVEVVNQGGQGYVTYNWPKPLAGGGATAELYPKLSYVKKFEPWGWVIGSGIYMDDVGSVVRSQILQNVLLVLVAGAVLLLFASVIASSIIRPLRKTVATMRSIGVDDGNLVQRLPAEGSSEIAQLAHGFNEMLENLQSRDAELARHREFLEDEVEQRTLELRQVNQALAMELDEHKRAEQTLRESRLRMRALLDATRESVLLLEPEGQILEINAFGAQRFRQTPAELVGQNFFDLMPPDLAATRRAVLQQVIALGEPTTTQDRRGTIFFDNSLYPVRNESGEVESVAVYAKDMSEQQRTKAVEDIFRHLDTVLLKWRMNLDSIAQMFCDGIMPVFDLAAAWIGRAEKDGRMTVLAGTAGDAGDFINQLRDSGLRWDGDVAPGLPVEAVVRHGYRRIATFADQDGDSPDASLQAIGAQVALLLPLTLRGEIWGVLTLYGRNPAQFEGLELSVRLNAIAVRLGVSLESAQQQEWLTLLDAALAGVGNAVFITDANATILWVNRAFVELSGYAADQLLGKNPKMFSSGLQGEDFYRRFWESIQRGDTWHGDIVNAHPDGSHYTVSQTITPLLGMTGEVSHYVAILEDISERKAAEERMRYAASFDLLTDLPNRSLFVDRLGQALALARRDGEGGAVLFLDLDRFKQVNDSLGHAAGDELLIAVAQRLRAAVRESDTVARLAGDEFTLILNRIREPANAAAIADKILAALAQPLTIAGTELTIGASIGIALYPEQGETIDEILEAADHAMYLAKKGGRHRHAFAGTDPRRETTPAK